MGNHALPSLALKSTFFISMIGILFFMGIFIAFSPFWHAALILIICCVLVLIFTKPEYMALFILIASVISHFPGLTKYIEDTRFVLIITVIFGWFLKKLILSQVDDNYRFGSNILAVPIAAFAIISLISYLNSTDIILSRRHFIVHLLSFSSLFMFCDLCRDKSFTKKLTLCLLALAFFTSLIAIMQYLIIQFNLFLPLENLIIPKLERREFMGGSESAVFNIVAFRSIGTFEHSNFLGMFLAILFPLTAAMFAYSRKKIEKLSLLLLLATFGIAIFCANSRGSILNIIASSLFLALMDMKRMHKILLLILCCAVIFVLIFPHAILQYLRLTEALSHRDVIWKNSVALFMEKPFLGYGIGAFSINYLKRFGIFGIDELEKIIEEIAFCGGISENFFTSSGIAGFTAHNVFLNYAVELGFLGPIILLWFYSVYLKKAFLSLRWRKTGYNRAVLLGVSGAVLGNFAHSFFEASTLFSTLSISIPFMAAASLGISEMARKE